MNKQISYKIVSLVFGILVICFAIAFYAFGVWTEPSSAPPGNNVYPPLNVGPIGQSKAGGLILNTGGAENGLIIDQGKVGIGTTTPGAKLHVDGTPGTDGIMFPDGSLQTTAAGTSYMVGYRATPSAYNLIDFGAVDSTFRYPSSGYIILPYLNLDGSYLFQMSVNVTTATTKTLYLGAVDNRIDFFMDGVHVAGPWLTGTHRTNVNFDLSAGEHTIQIIYNSQGGPDYLYLYGDIVDNENVYYKE